LETFVPLSKYYNLSLRDIERIFFQFNNFLRTGVSSWDTQIIAYLLILKISQHTEYQKMIEDLQISRPGLHGIDMEGTQYRTFSHEQWWKNLNLKTHIWHLDKKALAYKAQKHQEEFRNSHPDPHIQRPIDEETPIYSYFFARQHDFDFPLLKYHIQKLEFLDYFKLQGSLVD